MFRIFLALLIFCISVFAEESSMTKFMEKNCAECHNDKKTKGKFNLKYLGDAVNPDNIKYWYEALDQVATNEMPPEDDVEISNAERKQLVSFLKQKLDSLNHTKITRTKARRLNNREYANSVRDVLGLENTGTDYQTSNLIGDTLHHGFDNHGDNLIMSHFHLEEYINSARKIIDTVIFEGPKPEPYKYEIKAGHMRQDRYSHKVAKFEAIAAKKLEEARKKRIAKGLPPDPKPKYIAPNDMPARKDNFFDLRDPNLYSSFSNCNSLPESGYYKVKFWATGIDRMTPYTEKQTGIYREDPIQLKVKMGDIEKTFGLPDNEVKIIEMEEWLSKGTMIRFKNPTDGLRNEKSGTFKFQYYIEMEHIRKKDRSEYDRRIKNSGKKSAHWSTWTKYWQGQRPRVFKAEVEGPLFKTWPPQRQVALIGKDPRIEDAEEILSKIASRAYRRELIEGEIDPIIDLVKNQAKRKSVIAALKEGIISILVSPAFVYMNPVEGKSNSKVASKLSYFLTSSSPEKSLLKKNLTNEEIDKKVRQFLSSKKSAPFKREFPMAWLQLERINFMTPDTKKYWFYNRKGLNEDMINEALVFFSKALENNIPITEFLSANYSYINADLAKVYRIEGIKDSKFRKYTFTDGNRGGVLGMGAFLTLTADSLATNPIHRGVYVMENLLGIHPQPPPANVDIQEPDVRQAKSIKEILKAHTSEESCRSCHLKIDPYGFAFENFDPTGAWRNYYTAHIPKAPGKGELKKIAKQDAENKKKGLPPVAKPWVTVKPIPVDASSKLVSGHSYKDIKGFKKIMMTEQNQEKIVRCFIKKVLTYANGQEPKAIDRKEVDKILGISKSKEYRIVDTIVAITQSPLFRN